MEKNKMKAALLEFMEAFDDDDLPDGAWQATLEDCVQYFNEANGTNFDHYDAFIMYVQTHSTPNHDPHPKG